MSTSEPTRDDMAANLRGFGPAGLLAIVVIASGNFLFAPLSAILVLVWAHQSKTPWREIGFAPPRSWLWTIAGGAIAGVVLKLVMKAMIMPLIGADPINQTYHYVAGNAAALPGMLYAILVGAAFGEEVLFRGSLFERLGKLLGASAPAKAATLVITSILFGLAHLPDVPAAQQALFVGLGYGAFYLASGSLAAPMIAHATFNLTALALIYWRLEEPVANALFR